MGINFKEALGNIVEMTVPVTSRSINVSPIQIAEAVCCMSRHHMLEILFNIFTAAALVLGGATGNIIAVMLGVAGAVFTVVQSLASLYLSRRRGCIPDQLSRLAAYYIYNIIVSAYALSSSFRDHKLLISSGRVYKVYFKETSSGIEVILKPLS